MNEVMVDLRGVRLMFLDNLVNKVVDFRNKLRVFKLDFLNVKVGEEREMVI